MSKRENHFDSLVSRLDDLLAPCLSRDWPNLSVDRAEGCYLYGRDGRRYLDFLAGFAVCNVGHNHPRVISAAQAQMSKMIHVPMGVTNYESLLFLAEELGKIMPGNASSFFFGNSGTEAVDAAIKLARYFTRRRGIIAFIGGFHGRSIGSTAIGSSKAEYRTGHGPFIPDVYFSQFPYPFRSATPDNAEACCQAALDELIRLFEYIIEPEEVAAILVEPIQGEGGYVIPPRGWLAELRKICDQYGILLVFDEIQTGFGRTGEWFAANTFSVDPDIMCIAKAISNGFPLGAIAARPEIMKSWSPLSHGTTFGGNPIACAAGLAVIEIIRNEHLLENTRKHGAYMLKKLHDLRKKSTIIGDVRGVGLMIAVEFVKPDTNKEANSESVRSILQNCLDKGLLLYSCGHWSQTIRLIPPLIINRNQIDEGLEMFSEAVLEAQESHKK